MKKIFFLLLASYAFYSCSEQTGTKVTAGSFNMDSVKAAINANNKAFSESLKKGDSLACIASYTTDGCVMPTGTPKMCGVKGIGDFYHWTQQMGLGELVLTVSEVVGGKELVSEEGMYELVGKDGKSMDKGKYIVTWKQENGIWKKYRDIWNSDAPPPPPMPAKK
jgi:ketosteroid isomerase-like protein